jgi:flagellar protein FlgJ
MIDPVGANLARFQAARSAAPEARTAETNDHRMKEVADEFESLFVEQMLSAMRDTLDTKNRMLHGGMGEEYFNDLLYREYAKVMSKRTDFGIAEMIEESFRS